MYTISLPARGRNGVAQRARGFHHGAIVYKRIALAGGCGGIGRAVLDALRVGGAELAGLDLERSIERNCKQVLYVNGGMLTP